MKRKQMVYRYNGDAKTDEIEVDHDGEIPVPNQGDVLVRKSKKLASRCCHDRDVGH